MCGQQDISVAVDHTEDGSLLSTSEVAVSQGLGRLALLPGVHLQPAHPQAFPHAIRC